MARKSERIVKFSEKSIRGIVSPSSGRVEWWDESTPSLSCRVTANGVKSFYWVGRTAGRWKRTMIGQWPAMNVVGAQNEAVRLSGLAVQGMPVAARSRGGKGEWTLQELFEWYFENHSKPHKRTWKWDERQYENRLKHWAKRRVSTITKLDLQSLHLSVGQKNGPYAGNKVLELMGHMYRLGAELAGAHVPCGDPTSGIRRFPREERERFLDSDELPRFIAAVELLQRQVSKDFLMLCLWTGARRGNVCSMKWDDFSFKTKIWIIKKEDSKNKKPMNIVLSEPAIEILKRRKKTATGPYVLPGHGKSGHYTYPKDAMRITCKRAGLTDVRVHDLRRTLGSWMAVNTPLQTIGKQLGHKSLKSTAIYARLANKSLVDALATATKAMRKKAKAK